MKKILKDLLYVFLFIGGAFLLVFVGIGWFMFHDLNYYLPSQQIVREQFESHKADFIRLAELLQKEKPALWVERNGTVAIDGAHTRIVPEYGELIRKVGAKMVLIREDGSMEFELWGAGCAICDDSYMGVRYYPKNLKASSAGWEQTIVTSLDSKKLPQHNGGVASGLYVVPIEPEWYIYRYEYQE